ncbi:hypothetical protein VTJ49DRAFT_1515 [Mycothermus thermophilus]|uniref:Uncharacterized protein n=1 Tax=Humicola insolens TaxID=85995 RepID=A0ABR3VC65_HUMIN
MQPISDLCSWPASRSPPDATASPNSKRQPGQPGRTKARSSQGVQRHLIIPPHPSGGPLSKIPASPFTHLRFSDFQLLERHFATNRPLPTLVTALHIDRKSVPRLSSAPPNSSSSLQLHRGPSTGIIRLRGWLRCTRGRQFGQLPSVNKGVGPARPRHHNQFHKAQHSVHNPGS